ncbi:alpha/beta hydrolase [Undibacterium amnicola]|uniref:Alpha/beta hydrolase n=1 Tax=Undibacterium amnicola TaxID=1834038 RepID=A0ABR6XTB2_9BURK|nr:alpha/beta hydrolase [Undibacterium amnicola]
MDNFSDYDFIIQPGWKNSGSDHWQTHWERVLDAKRVANKDWEEPALKDWLDGLDTAIGQCAKPVVVIAHSLGCATVAHYAANFPQKIHAALLVAPADVERENAPSTLGSFAPLPQLALPFSSRVIASTNDPFCDRIRAEKFSATWGSSVVYLVAAGHINTASGHTEWNSGLEELRSLLEIAGRSKQMDAA